MFEDPINEAFSEEQSMAYIKSRRSIFPKEYSSSDVSRQDIENLLEAARWAPTHKKTEPWGFQVFQGSSMLELVEMQIGLMDNANMSEEAFKIRAEKMRLKASLTGAIIAIVMQRDELERVPRFEEEWAVAAAVQNIQLHALSLNLGVYWSTGGSMNHSVVRQKLALSENDLHMGWLFVGKINGEINRPVSRKEVKEFVEWK